MSKRNSVGQSNTLLNYFQSPKGKTTPSKPEKTTPAKQPQTKQKYVEKNEDSEEEVQVKKKRHRIMMLESDSDSENGSPNKPPPKKSKAVKKAKAKVDTDKSEDDDDDDIHDQNGTKTYGRDSLKSFAFNKSFKDEPEEKRAKLEEPCTSTKKPVSAPDVSDIHTSWKHNRLEFLKPDKIRDAAKRRPGDPQYDYRTLHVPEDFLSKQTPAMRQWWELKSKHMDSVLFFKVGKFYELYHMDAVVGVKHLGFSYMKGEFAHSGFPESAYAKMASTLIDKGFKIARVEQTETPQMMSDRCKLTKKTTKFDKVVKREICQITTKATCVYSAQLSEARHALPCYLYAIREKQLSGGKVRLGACFVDTSIGTFHLSEFDDDKYYSKLLVLLAEHTPGLILTERGPPSPNLTNLLKAHFADVRKDTLANKSQFYTATSTLEKLASECYFKDKNDKFEWPEIFKELADDCVPKTDYELAIRCLGACMWYLKDSELDIQVLSMKKFVIYKPVNFSDQENVVRDFMVLDSDTMRNLSLLGGRGTLQHTWDYCETAFGKRLLLQWICRPLCNHEAIIQRQNAIKELWNNPGILSATRQILSTMPDLERQVAKIHSFGNRFCAKSHPDSRAIFYEAATYSKRKIKDLLKTLKAFEKAQEIVELFTDTNSLLLKNITQYAPVGMNLDLTETLQFFKEAFDQNEAQKEGKITPKHGVEADYDAAEDRVKEINKKLDDYLKQQQKFFGCAVAYFGSDKKRFQLEIPEHRDSRVTDEYQLEGTKKGAKPCKRYSTPTTKALLAEMMNAEAEQTKIILDINRRIYEKFSQRFEEWNQVIQCLTILDVICALSEYARRYPEEEICFPTVVPFSPTDAHIALESSRYPCVAGTQRFVENSLNLGVEEDANTLIITGPNMGGKSTLMRQAAIISIMAQIGSAVPAAKCSLTMIDRIFTRLGAHDDIIKGQSTFFVELSEAASILKHATNHSLVLLDELGRGTSTHDGNAIATAYLRKLTEIKCRAMFSTHYHSLVDHFVDNQKIQLGHMACMVENDDHPTQESVTFLYKMVKGRCPKSYGFNAARLAGLEHSIVMRGREIAKQLENETNNRNILSNLFRSDVEDVRKLLSLVNI